MMNCCMVHIYSVLIGISSSNTSFPCKLTVYVAPAIDDQHLGSNSFPYGYTIVT